MGNTSECTFLSTSDQQYQFLGEEDHFLYGEIRHFKSQKVDNEHFAIKKIRFQSQNSLKKFRDFLSLYSQMCQPLHLTQATEYKSSKAKPQQKQDTKSIKQQDQQPLFHCNKDNLIFTSATEQLSCSEASYYMTLNLEYLQERCSLQSLLMVKSQQLHKAVQGNKVNQNILLELENKVKMYEYQKIDKLPPKERAMVNLFFNQIEVLRILDHMLTALYGLKINDLSTDAVRPQLFFKSSPSQKISLFYPQSVNISTLGNFRKSYQSLKKWLDQQNALFHHNWNMKQRQLVFYLHPDQLERLAECLVNHNGQSNFGQFGFNDALSRDELERQNIFALGLIVLEICLLQPGICSKIYHISTCKTQEKPAISKRQIKYSFQKHNLTIKLNQNILQKYLIQMKTKYSEQFVQLVEFMLLGQTYTHANKTKVEHLNYQSVIQRLALLTKQNINNLKEVYHHCPTKGKSMSKHPSEKQSRKSSLSRQASASGVSNPSLSSSSSLSIFPVQSHQKVLSVELLRKNVKGIQTKANTVMVKSQLQTLHGSFAKREQKLEELVKKDEERILLQLNKLNNSSVTLPQKQQRFAYRKNGQTQLSRNNMDNNQHYSFANTPISQTKTNELYGSYKINFPPSLSFKSNSQSLDKQKRINSTTKTKKAILQKARQEQNMGSSQTIYLNKSRTQGQQKQKYSGNSTNNDTVLRKIDPNLSKQSSCKEIEPFYQGPSSFGGKSQLKNLIAIRNKNSMAVKEHTGDNNNEEDKLRANDGKSPKELKSKQLYEIYMKEYRNLVQSQQLVKQ